MALLHHVYTVKLMPKFKMIPIEPVKGCVKFNLNFPMNTHDTNILLSQNKLFEI